MGRILEQGDYVITSGQDPVYTSYNLGEVIPFLQLFSGNNIQQACRWDDGSVDSLRKQLPSSEQWDIWEFVLIWVPSDQELRQRTGDR